MKTIMEAKGDGLDDTRESSAKGESDDDTVKSINEDENAEFQNGLSEYHVSLMGEEQKG